MRKIILLLAIASMTLFLSPPLISAESNLSFSGRNNDPNINGSKGYSAPCDTYQTPISMTEKFQSGANPALSKTRQNNRGSHLKNQEDPGTQ